jgi:hypothetical protein
MCGPAVLLHLSTAELVALANQTAIPDRQGGELQQGALRLASSAGLAPPDQNVQQAFSLTVADGLIRLLLRQPTLSSSLQYGVACLRARRYVLLAAPPRQPNVIGAADARSTSLKALRTALATSPRLAAWARHDPAFSHLLVERDFDLATRSSTDPAPLSVRDPWIPRSRPS